MQKLPTLHCCCVDDVDPAGQTKPAVHAPVHDALKLPVALPKRPAGHRDDTPPMQKLPTLHAVWLVRVVLLPPVE
jgi:hypothetical protein